MPMRRPTGPRRSTPSPRSDRPCPTTSPPRPPSPSRSRALHRRPPVHVTAGVIGAGPAGLATRHRPTSRSIGHVVLQRGQAADARRTERRDSLRLLTPNWQPRLPGMDAQAGHADGFVTMPEVAALLQGYAHHVAAPLRTRTTVTRVAALQG